MTAYALITPARNEAATIEITMRSVLAQSCLPRKWVIVDDGSTDGTGERVELIAREHPWVCLHRPASGARRDFASQVHATCAGYAIIEDGGFDFVGMLDADISIEPDYYSRLLERCIAEPRLGIAGGTVIDVCDGRLLDIRAGSEKHHVAGGVQFFRRECYEEIGGYPVLPQGGQDVAVEVMARMAGWDVRAFPDLRALHHKPPLSTGSRAWLQWFRNGIRNYALGTHPLYQIARSFHRIQGIPLCSRWVALAGYGWAALRREPRPLPGPVMTLLRREQILRLQTRIRRGLDRVGV